MTTCRHGPLATSRGRPDPRRRRGCSPGAVASGDAAATATLDEAAGHYAHALSHVVHLLDPDVIVLGGGAEIGPPWRDAVARKLAPLLMETMLPAPLPVTQETRR